MVVCEFLLIELIREFNILRIAVTCCCSSFETSEVIYPMRSLSIICVSTSAAEPAAMYKKCITSLSVPRAYPSATFIGIDVAARRIWLTMANNSSRGNRLVMEYIVSAKSIDICHTRRSLCDCMLNQRNNETTKPLNNAINSYNYVSVP